MTILKGYLEFHGNLLQVLIKKNRISPKTHAAIIIFKNVLISYLGKFSILDVA